MRCFLPFVEELSAAGKLLLQVAQELGADCVPVQLPRRSANPEGDLNGTGTKSSACLAITPEVVRAWLGTGELPAALVACLLARFQTILVYHLDTDSTSTKVLRTLSKEVVTGAHTVSDPSCGYQVSSEELCGTFSGLTFGPARVEDRVLRFKSGALGVAPLICINGEPLFAIARFDKTEVLFLGGVPTADGLKKDVAGCKVSEYFSELLPIAMFLRHAFQNECWRPVHPPHATFIVDDPPLWRRYGFVNYERLLASMDQFNFHTTIAFIPYYWKSSNSSIVRLFRQRPDRFSLCFHGNDHTGGELASNSDGELNYVLSTARARMQSFTARTGVACSNVMVFPQGRFSRGAMCALKAHGFLGAVNSGHSPYGEQHPLIMTEVMHPSILSHEGFPLFLRQYVKQIRPEDIAYHAFFGRPILIVEHHELFKEPTPLFDLVSMINRLVPDVRWTNLQTSLETACLVRTLGDGIQHFRSYAKVCRIENPGPAPCQCVVEWPDVAESIRFGNLAAVNDSRGSNSIWDTVGPLLPVKVDSGCVQTIAYPYTLGFRDSSVSVPSFRKKIKIFLRRRLSEVRDNYLSKSAIAKYFVNSVQSLLSRR